MTRETAPRSRPPAHAPFNDDDEGAALPAWGRCTRPRLPSSDRCRHPSWDKPRHERGSDPLRHASGRRVGSRARNEERTPWAPQGRTGRSGSHTRRRKGPGRRQTIGRLAWRLRFVRRPPRTRWPLVVAARDRGETDHKRKEATLFRMASVLQRLERETGFEPATSTLARWHSTAELLPRARRGGLYLATLGLSTSTRSELDDFSGVALLAGLCDLLPIRPLASFNLVKAST